MAEGGQDLVADGAGGGRDGVDIPAGGRVMIDFTGTATGSFGPGDVLSLHYETQNVPESTTYPDLAPIAVPDAGGIAWNQMGAVGTDAGGREYSVAPVQRFSKSRIRRSRWAWSATVDFARMHLAG